MSKCILAEETVRFLEANPFVNMASCGPDMRPNVSCKFFLRVDEDTIYLGDYNIDRTLANIMLNARTSLSIIDPATLVAYQINGEVDILEDEGKREHLLDEFNKKVIRFSTKRLIEGVQREKTHRAFETTFPEQIVIYKVTVNEVIEMRPTGELARRCTLKEEV